MEALCAPVSTECYQRHCTLVPAPGQSGHMSKSPWPGKPAMHRPLRTEFGPSSGVLQVHPEIIRNKHPVDITYLAVNLGSQISCTEANVSKSVSQLGKPRHGNVEGLPLSFLGTRLGALSWESCVLADHTIPPGIHASSPEQATCSLVCSIIRRGVHCWPPACSSNIEDLGREGVQPCMEMRCLCPPQVIPKAAKYLFWR